MSKKEHKYSDGSIYIGTWSVDGQRDGHGTLTYVNGTRYAGEFSKGLQEGFGIMEIPDGWVILNIHYSSKSGVNNLIAFCVHHIINAMTEHVIET